MVTIQTVELERADNPAPRGDFLGPYVDWDSAGFQHEIFVRQAGTQTDDSTTLHYTKKNAQGQLVDQGTIQPPTDVAGRAMKYVNIGAPLIIIPPASSVGSFIVPFTAHGAGPNGGRRILRDYHVIPDVYAPHPRGEQANERFDVTLPTGGTPPPPPDPGGSGVTPQDIEAIKNAVAAQIRQEFGGNIRQGIMDKSRDGASQALSQAGVLTTGNAASTLYQPIKDRVYEVFSQNAAGFWPWLAAKVRGASQPQQAQSAAPAPASQTAAGPRPDTLDVNVSHAPFDNAHQLGMTGQTEEGEQ